MNERIKQLAEQAGLNYHNWITKESNVNNGDFKYPRLEDYENFAELIVKDIAKTVFKHLYNEDTVAVYNEYGWDCLPGDLRTMIEEHFGVEE